MRSPRIKDLYLVNLRDLGRERAYFLLSPLWWLARPVRPAGGTGRPTRDCGERDDGGGLTITAESAAAPMGLPVGGVVAHGHGRVEVALVDGHPLA